MNFYKIMFVTFLVCASVALAYEYKEVKEVKVDPYRPVPPPNPDREMSARFLDAFRYPPMGPGTPGQQIGQLGLGQ